MTYLEKLKLDHPTLFDLSKFNNDIYDSFCPDTFCYKVKCSNYPDCSDCWNSEMPEEPKSEKKEYEAPSMTVVDAMKKVASDKPKILDSGNRREFETGAVRDIQEGKGRCDLMPLDVVCEFRGKILATLNNFQESGNTRFLFSALQQFIDIHMNKDMSTTFLEVSKHFEEGAKKYGENNWQKGIPVRCYIDSAVRHYLKFLRGDKDEPHDRAFCWNIMCAIWTCKHKPELNDYAKKEET